MATYAEQLTRVQDAIAAIEEGGQSVHLPGGEQLSYADLDTLYKREKWLRRQAARETRGGGIRVRGVTPT